MGEGAIDDVLLDRGAGVPAVLILVRGTGVSADRGAGVSTVLFLVRGEVVSADLILIRGANFPVCLFIALDSGVAAAFL